MAVEENVVLDLETAQAVERVVPFPRKKRALMFFEVFSRIKQALESLGAEDRLKPGRN